LPHEPITADIHCVTKWSKLDTHWEGVSLDTLLAQVETHAGYVIAFSDGGYTTNLPIADVRGGKAWIADAYEGAPIPPEHGARPGSSSRISTSGKAPSGCGVWSCRRWTDQASGSRLATTTMVIHGKSSATKAIELAARGDRGAAPGDGAGQEPDVVNAKVAGAPRGSACRRAADGRGRGTRRNAATPSPRHPRIQR